MVVQGSYDGEQWEEYEFLAKPTNISRQLPIIAPYQPRIDWQIWFAAMSIPDRHPWLIHMVWKLLHNDPGTLSLISKNPFVDEPPRFIRIEHYKYEFLEPGSENVWKRTYLGSWLPPSSTETQGMREFVEANGWG